MSVPLLHKGTQGTQAQAGHKGGAAHKGTDSFGPPGVLPYTTDKHEMLLGVPLSVRITTPRLDSVISREIADISFGGAVPGGFTSCSMRLYRPLKVNPEDIRLYGKVYITDVRTGETVWQGRLEDPGRTSELWEIAAVGPAAHARDRRLPLMYVDSHLNNWRPHGALADQPAGDLQLITDDVGNDSLQFQVRRGIVATADAWLSGFLYTLAQETGLKLARYDYTWDAGRTTTAWKIDAVTRPGIGVAGEAARSETFTTSGSGSSPRVVVTHFSNGRDVMELRVYCATNDTPADETTWLKLTGLVITFMRYNADGTEITTGYGATVLSSDVVKDLLGRMLPKYAGATASIATTSFAINHLAYPDSATAEEVLNDLMVIDPGYFWAAWEGDPARFEYSAWPTTVGLVADAREDKFDSPASSAELFNECRVRYLDVFGRTQTNVRTNPVQELTDAGLTRTAFLNLSDNLGFTLVADRVGDQFLLEHATAPNAGTLSIRRPILSLAVGRMLDPWELPKYAPGKLISVRDVAPRVDALNPAGRDGLTIFKVVEAVYDAASNTASLSLDSQPRTLTRLLSPMTIPNYTNPRIR